MKNLGFPAIESCYYLQEKWQVSRVENKDSQYSFDDNPSKALGSKHLKTLAAKYDLRKMHPGKT